MGQSDSNSGDPYAIQLREFLLEKFRGSSAIDPNSARIWKYDDTNFHIRADRSSINRTDIKSSIDYRIGYFYDDNKKIQESSFAFEKYQKGEKGALTPNENKLTYNELIEKIKEVLGLMLMKKQLEDIIEADNKQIIFTGAPGTGKTYTARKHVEEKGKKQHEGYEFVQFHSSYDYTDFVEGLRPVRIDGNDNPTFVRMDGVFKEFCRKIVEKELEDFIEKMFKEEKIDKNLSANQKKILLDYYYMKEILSNHCRWRCGYFCSSYKYIKTRWNNRKCKLFRFR